MQTTPIQVEQELISRLQDYFMTTMCIKGKRKSYKWFIILPEQLCSRQDDVHRRIWCVLVES